jgi:hypothetical protein
MDTRLLCYIVGREFSAGAAITLDGNLEYVYEYTL